MNGSNFDIVKCLLANGATVNAKKENDGKTPLHIAVGTFNTSIAKCLLDFDAKINARDEDGWTP